MLRKKCSVFCSFAAILLFILIVISSSFVTVYAYERVKFVGKLQADLEVPVDVAVSVSGDVYVLDEKKSRVVVFDRNGMRINFFGSYGSEPGMLQKPRALAVSPSGDIVVADTGNNRIQVFDSAGKLVAYFGSSGSEPGQFDKPVGVVVDLFGFIYVADSGNARIQIFTASGILLRLVSTGYEPVDIALDMQSNIFVLIPEIESIVKYSLYGKKLRAMACFVDGYNYAAKAVGLAVDMRGDIYITEGLNYSVKKINAKQRVLLSFGSEGKGRGEFDTPAGIASDNLGRIYVADSENKRVQILSVSGSKSKLLKPILKSQPLVVFDSSIKAEKYISDIFFVPKKGLYTLSDKNNHLVFLGPPREIAGREGDGEGEFDTPRAVSVATEGGYNGLGLLLYMQDKTIKVLRTMRGSPAMKSGLLEGERIEAINGKSANGMMLKDAVAELRKNINAVTKLAVASIGLNKVREVSLETEHIPFTGRVYVADTANNSIHILSLDGTHEYQFGKEGSKNGRFKNPQGVFVNVKNIIYVADTGNHRIQVFNGDGIFLNSFGREGEIEDGRPPDGGTFLYPKALSMDSSGRLYVLDSGNNVIQFFSEDGRYLGLIGGKGSAPGFFDSPVDIAIDERDFLYVADRGNSRVQIFNRNGKLVMIFGAPARTKGWFSSYSSNMTLDADSKAYFRKMPSYFEDISSITAFGGKIYVADHERDSIQVFKFHPNGIKKEEHTHTK